MIDETDIRIDAICIQQYNQLFNLRKKKINLKVLSIFVCTVKYSKQARSFNLTLQF